MHGISDRQELITEAVIFIWENNSDLFFRGSGFIHSKAHNFVLNLILGVGLVFSFFYLLMLAYLFLSIILTKVLFNDKLNANNINIINFGLTFMLIGNSTFNGAYTQPLYFFNFLIIIFIIRSNYYSRCNKEIVS